MRSSGFEPPRYCYRQPLKLVRLPVPPRPQKFTTDRGPDISNRTKTITEQAWGSTGKEADFLSRFREVLSKAKESDQKILMHGSKNGRFESSDLSLRWTQAGAPGGSPRPKFRTNRDPIIVAE